MSDHRKLIIDLPHLQSFTQRVGSLIVGIACWLLWIYFLVPIVTLAGWLMGVRKFSHEIRWFGGYKSLVGLMELYADTVVIIAVFWLLWTVFTSLRPVLKHQPLNSFEQVQAETQFIESGVSLSALCFSSSVTVSFDDHGHITGISPVFVVTSMDTPT